MAVTADTVQFVTVTVICFVLIAVRTLYRTFFRCKVHVKCHRKWHPDDIWMAASVFPLMGRALTIAWSASLTETSVDASISKAEQFQARSTASKLLLPGRIFYMLL